MSELRPTILPLFLFEACINQPETSFLNDSFSEEVVAVSLYY